MLEVRYLSACLMRSFADLPAIIEARAAECEQLAVVLLDAFGMAFVERHADHPLLRRLEIEPLRSQFPSTTTAHLTTLYSGLPVEEHGLYEWRCYEPQEGRVIRPLLFAARPRGDAAAADHAAPAAAVAERVRAAADDRVPARGDRDTPYGSAALAGARGRAVQRRSRTASRKLARDAGAELPLLGPDRRRRPPATARRRTSSSSSRCGRSTRSPTLDTPLLVTADHGQIDVTVTDDLAALWPPLLEHLTQDPAGSARDLFLHVDDPALVVHELSSRVEGTVHLAADLFPDAGPRLLERLADVCVLPAPGRMVGVRAFPSPEGDFKGHHGGLTPEEMETWVGMM